MSENIYKFTELEAMTKEDFVHYFPQKRAKWLKKGFLVDAQSLIIAVIRSASKRSWQSGDNRGVREFWYNPIKAILMRAIGSRAETYSGYFENKLSELVKAGELKYTDLGIQDFTTLREMYMAIDKAKCWTSVVLFVEKDSAYVHLRPLKELFNINIISGSGWSKTASIESQLNLLKQSGITKIRVYLLTDLDPFGFAIGTEFVEKCKTLGFTIESSKRIGINVEHATPGQLDVQKYPIKMGRKLTERESGISYDSDDWLKEYGIEGKYGLEIEAVSGQPNGHQRLREIVATELLKDLKESDRIEEITNGPWLTAPVFAIKRLLKDIDEQDTETDNILNKPSRLPTKYIDYDDYSDQWNEIVDRRESATKTIDDRIADLESQLAELNAERHEITQPFAKEQDTLAREYEKSRNVLAYCLYLKYMDYKLQELRWLRKDYDLGYPEGCILDSVKKGDTLQKFLMRIDREKITNDILTELQSDYESGAIDDAIDSLMN